MIVYIPEIMRPENMKINHVIPIGTLVEVNLPSNEKHGVPAFVVEHTRDCDGSPLYAISLSSAEQLVDIKELFGKNLYRFMIDDGWTDECLTVISPPSQL